MTGTKSKSIFGIIIKVVITVATALAGVFGLNACAA
ncbi:MAG: smalltalk protein [Bacteroides sp.]|nr:smalltalk protein [Bacteroides sp.]